MATMTTEARALASMGTSGEAIYRAVTRAIRDRHPGGGIMVDVGCGAGLLQRHVAGLVDEYIGADVVRYEGFPVGGAFREVNLDACRVDLPDGAADIVACVETIEHLENPRALVRELARLARPGGLVIVTTPNQLSLLSKLCLLMKGEFAAFLDAPGLYPSHISALLPIDLVRIARECCLTDTEIRFTDSGRIPGTGWRWPWPLRGRPFSDNVLMIASRAT